MTAMQLRNRLVPDPMMTDAQYLYEVQQERQRARDEGREPKLSVGKVWAVENAVTRLGALCFIRRRQDHHEKAAEHFKNLYEHLYGSGNPAVDPARVQVDTSIQAHDSGIAAKIDRTRALHEAEVVLGKAAYNRLVALLVLCIPAGQDVDLMPSGRRNDRQVKASIDQVLEDLDQLADVWGY